MSAAEENTSHPDTSDTPKHQYSGQGMVRSVEITAEEIWVGSRVGAVSLPTCRELQWTWRRDIYCSIISSTSPGNLVLSNVPPPASCSVSGVAQVADHDQGSSKHESALGGARVIISTLSTVYLHSIYTQSVLCNFRTLPLVTRPRFYPDHCLTSTSGQWKVDTGVRN